MAAPQVFHEVSRAERPSQQTTQSDGLSYDRGSALPIGLRFTLSNRILVRCRGARVYSITDDHRRACSSAHHSARLLADRTGSPGGLGHTALGSGGSGFALLVAARLGYAGAVEPDAEALVPGAGDAVPPVPQPAVAGSEGDDGQRLLVQPDGGRAGTGGRAERGLPVCGTGPGIDPAVSESGQGAGGARAFEPGKPAAGVRRPGAAGWVAGSTWSGADRAPVVVPLRRHGEREDEHRGTHSADLSRLGGGAVRGGSGRAYYFAVRPRGPPAIAVSRRHAGSAVGGVRAAVHHGGRRACRRRCWSCGWTNRRRCLFRRAR